MRKRNISLARAYLGFYVLIAFAGALPVFLSFKFAPALSIVLLVLEVLCLAGVICSNVFYDRKMNKEFYLTGMISYLVFDVIFAYGYILEIVYTAQGKPATYAWVMGSICLVALALINLFVALGMYRLKHPIEEI